MDTTLPGHQRWIRLGNNRAGRPWSYIGYWGSSDHLLAEVSGIPEDYAPGKLATYFDEAIFVFANVPTGSNL